MAVRGFDVGGMFQRSGGRIGANIGAGAAAMGAGLEGMFTGIRGGLKERQERLDAEKTAEKLAGIYAPVTQEGAKSTQLFQAAQQLMSMPNKTKEAMALLEQARAMQITEQSKASLQKRKEAMATRAVSLGLPEVASNIRSATDADTLDDIAKDLRETEIKRLPSQTRPQRLARAKRAGITETEFNDLGLAKATDDFFNDYVTGEKGKTEAWLDEQGEVVTVRFNESGKAWDETNQRFVEASALGLVQPAPVVQKIVDVSNKMIEGLADESIKDIKDLRDKARTAKEKLGVIERQLTRLGTGMPTGIAANIQVGLAQVGQLLNMPYNPELVSAQEYMMEVANLVKQEIKAFGSGTSITDADREYTQRMVGGDITQQAEALEAMLKIYRDSAKKTINQYNEIISGTSAKLGSENMGTFQQITLPQEQLSPAALKYLDSDTEDGTE